VGSGPAGFYAAKYLAEQRVVDGADVHVDILEQFPVPFGLVRYGVAPDHPEVKTVEATFSKVAANPLVRFFGNVRVGTSVSVQDLQRVYDAVVLACGAEEDRPLGLKGEGSFSNVLSAREFVRWYNGHPLSYAESSGKVSPAASIGALVRRARNIVIIGNGNVALDCARVLVKDPSELAATDVTQNALAALSEARAFNASSPRSVSVVGRRGAAQAAFTIKEMRELTKLTGVAVTVSPEEFAASMTAESIQEVQASRPRSRLVELVKTLVPPPLPPLPHLPPPSSDATGEQQASSISLRFLLRPSELRASPSRPGELGSVVFTRTALHGAAENQNATDCVPPHSLELPCDLLIASVGYRSVPLAFVPWDARTSTVPNVAGRVLPAGTETESGTGGRGLGGLGALYVVGWLKRGPTGIIASAVVDAKETVQALLVDLRLLHQERAQSAVSPRPDPVDLIPTLQVGSFEALDTNTDTDLGTDRTTRVSASVSASASAAAAPAPAAAAAAAGAVSWEEWGRVDAAERQRGAALSPPKPREKVTSVAEMLSIAKGSKEETSRT